MEALNFVQAATSYSINSNDTMQARATLSLSGATWTTDWQLQMTSSVIVVINLLLLRMYTA